MREPRSQKPSVFSRDAQRSAGPPRRAALLTAFLLVGSAIISSGCSERSAPASSTTVSNSTDAGVPKAQQTSPAENNAAATGVAREQNDKANAAAAGPVEIAPAKSQAIRDITFDTIKFDMQKDEPFERRMIKPPIEKLDRTKIRIRGYILPSFQQSGLTQFVLVRDNMQCCFGPGAALYDCIVVQMEPGKTAEFTTHPVAVDGVFSIRELRGSENKCLAIYHLDAERVQ